MEWGNLYDSSTIIVLVTTLCIFIVPIFIIFPPIPVEKGDALQQTHSKIGLVSSKSNLRNQLSGDHSAQDGESAKIQSLYIYPVKSCRGIELSKSRVLPTGLEHDRLYTFAQLKSPFPVSLSTSEEEKDDHKWEFITQRQFPRLATVDVDLWVPDAKKKSRLLEQSNESFIVFRFPWQETGIRGTVEWIAAKLGKGLRGVPEREVLLPVEFPSEEEIAERKYEYENVKIWKETVRALNMEVDLPEELSLYLGVSNKLGIFRIHPQDRREVFRAAPRKEEAGYQPIIDFHDAFPLHLMNLSSVGDLDSKLIKDENWSTLDVRRFRSNIIVSGAEKYDEESWKVIRFRQNTPNGHLDSVFDVSCRTVRCRMPNVDQNSGVRHDVEPDKALRKYRAVDEGAPRKGCMGMQLCPLFDKTSSKLDLESWVEVGMTMEILERGMHVYIPQ